MLRALLRWSLENLDQQVDSRSLIALRPQPRRRRPKQQLLTDNDLKSVQAKADATTPSVGALIHCLMTYGWRPITAADLIVEDYHAARGVIVTRVKGGDVIEHPLLPETIKRLNEITKNRLKMDPLFTHPRTGKAWHPSSSSGYSIVQFCRVWLGTMSYDLKRAAISKMLARGIPPQTVALFTGHRTISQVLTYARTNEDVAREALALL